MLIRKWKAGLLAGLSILALASSADAGEVRMTVAEYSAKTGPYFEEVKKAFEAEIPASRSILKLFHGMCSCKS